MTVFPSITLIACMHHGHTAISAFLFTNSASSALVSTVVTFFDAILIYFTMCSNLQGCQQQKTTTMFRRNRAKDFSTREISCFAVIALIRGLEQMLCLTFA